MELPTVGEVPGVAELAAGSPIVEPRPLGPPLFEPAWFDPACANASVLDRASMPASAIDESFMMGFLIQSLIMKQTAAVLDVPTACRALEALIPTRERHIVHAAGLIPLLADWNSRAHIARGTIG